MQENSVYELMPMLDTPGFASFSVSDNSPVAGGYTLISDFAALNPSSRNWQAPRLAHAWQKRWVIDPLPGQVNDYPTIGLRIPLFSERACEALRDLLEPNGEILPVNCKTGTYVAHNPTSVVDALNRETSDIKWPDLIRLRKHEPIIAEQIKYHDFIPERVAGLSIFRIPEDICDFYVTERFASRVREFDLRGFNLRKLWPLPRPKMTGSIAEMERRAGLA